MTQATRRRYLARATAGLGAVELPHIVATPEDSGQRVVVAVTWPVALGLL